MLKKGTFINNRYEIEACVGAGGMADVYKAKDHKLNRNVAVKILKSEFAADKNFVAKFRAEAQSAASLIHPNIVNVYDVGEDGGLYYIVMELIEGLTLESYIKKKGRLSAKETISIAIQIANGIECAHNNQIIHRDIKPQNVMISREGRVKVTDFGIARAVSANTLSGNAMGSVRYISPEQAAGKYVDERSDIYSLGITMFQMITGRVPFDGETTVSVAIKHIQGSVPKVGEYVDNVPTAVEAIIQKCTQNKASLRYPKISLLIADLRRADKEPYGDFVEIIEDTDTTSTIMITDDDVRNIQNETGSLPDDNKSDKKDDDNDIDAANKKMDRALIIGGIVAGILVLVIIAVVVTVLLTERSVNIPKVSSVNEAETLDPKKAEVPDVVGKNADEAESILHEEGLGYQYDSEYIYSDIYAADTIVAQSEEPGSIVDKNSTITLSVSRGPEKIQVPGSIKGANLEKATSKLEDLGLNWTVTYEYSNEDIGTVISCSPSEKTTVTKNDTIDLTVSRGKQSDGEYIATIPGVVGMKFGKAEEKISSAGFGIGEVRYEYSDTVEEGYVIRQTVKSGGIAPLGTSIGLVVSNGSEEDKVYYATYTFAKEDLNDAEGNPITEGTVSVLLDGAALAIDEEYVNIESWPGDYTIEVSGNTKGKATLQLLVNGELICEDTVKLK